MRPDIRRSARNQVGFFALLASASLGACALDVEGRYVGNGAPGADAGLVDVSATDVRAEGQTGGTAGWPSGGSGGVSDAGETGGSAGTSGAAGAAGAGASAGASGAAGASGSAGSGGTPLCGPAEKLCGNTCVGLDDPQFGCAAISCDPCEFDYATAACLGGLCSLASCQEGWGNCNGEDADGCETVLQTDPTNCGDCGRTCSNAHGTTSCSAGTCEPVCDDGFGDCDGDLVGGCETDTQSSVNDCGTCGVVCADGFNCRTGNCGCAANNANCNGGVPTSVNVQCVQLSGADKCSCNGVQCEYGERCVGTGQCG